MGALKQYLSLYDGYAEKIDEGSAQVLNSLRPAARKALEEMRLPERGDEGFEKTSIEKMFAPDFGVNIMRLKTPTDVARSFKCDVPNVSTLLGVVVNDSFAPTTTLLNNLPAGVQVMSLAKAAREYPEEVGKYYGKIAPGNNAGVALNTLLVQDGVFIRVPNGLHLSQPVQIVNIFNSATPVAAFRRVLVVAEEDSEMNVLFCDHTQSVDTECLSSEVIEVYAGKNSRVGIYFIEESSAKTSRYSQLFVEQSARSEVRINSSTLLNGVTRNDFTVNIKGEECVTDLSGMVIADKRMHVDNCSNINHLAAHSKSNQLFKYLLDDESQGAFEGGIFVSKEAPYTSAYQNNRNLLAGPKARIHTKPQLLIYNDEVKASHGAAMGQLDANALFYMQQRGIPVDVAKGLLMVAFMTDALETITVPGIKSRLAMLVEKRLSGEQSLCGDCMKECANNENLN